MRVYWMRVYFLLLIAFASWFNCLNSLNWSFQASGVAVVLSWIRISSSGQRKSNHDSFWTSFEDWTENLLLNEALIFILITSFFLILIYHLVTTCLHLENLKNTYIYNFFFSWWVEYLRNSAMHWWLAWHFLFSKPVSLEPELLTVGYLSALFSYLAMQGDDPAQALHTEGRCV